ncbi:hypothetical protein CXB51_009659 [Gossypium anomalum]|uniref:DUF7745 domain-containing protein n=1 Tax=Gossypium anomalum TaxID=47600 RepID=A0A8J5YTA4_9ROSI|nr:hypothetical protein CXB51_009659 [Gossypium anomalum]
MTVVVTSLSGSEKLRLREVFASVQDSGSLSGYIRTYGFVRFSSLCSHREILLDRVEGNVNVHRWSEQTQAEKGDSIVAGYVSELSEDLPYLLDVQIDEHLFRALTQFWNPAYSYFTFGEVDLVPTVEEYTALLRCPRFQIDRIYSRAVNVPTFWKKLMAITGMSEQWITARIKEKGECKCISWEALKGLILTHPDETKRVDVFALSFKRVTSVPTILAETFRSLGSCRKAGAGRRADVPEENWIALLQNLQSKDVEWRASWMIPGEILYRCGSFDWVPLLGIWGAIGYAPLLVLRQFGLRQFVPATHGLTQSEFAYRGADYKKRVREISSAWNKTCRLKGVAIGPVMTSEYLNGEVEGSMIIFLSQIQKKLDRWKNTYKWYPQS